MKITKKQKFEIKKIALKHKLRLIILFGSFANGKEKKDSDIDLAVLSDNSLELKNELELIKDFSQIFKKEPDISIINKANPLLLNEISQNSFLLYGEKADFINFKLHAFHRYNDYLPFFKLEKKFVKQAVKNLQ